MQLFLKQVIYLLGQDKNKLPFLFIIFLIASGLDLIGIGLIGTYVVLLADVKISSEIFVKLVRIFEIGSEKEQILLLTGYALIAVFLVKTIFSIWINRIIIRFSAKQHVRLTSFLMSSFQSLSYVDYIKRNSAEYVYSIHHLSSQYANHVVSPLLRMVSDGILIFGVIIFLAVQSPVGLGILVVLVLVMILFYDTLFRKKMAFYGEQCNLASETILKVVSEAIEGLKEIRILGKENYFHKKLMKTSNELMFFSIKSSVVQVSLRYLLELTMITFVVALVLSAVLLENSIDSLYSDLGVFGVACLRLFPTVNTFMQGLTQMRYGKDTVLRLFNDVNRLQKLDMKTSDVLRILPKHEKFKSLRLKNLCFFYPQSKTNIIDDISFDLKEGESIGFIGASGSGKTTLLDTVLGLFVPQGGSIEFNGSVLSKHLSEWRDQVAYIPQQVFLIDDSLRCNIALGVIENEIDDIKLDESLHRARLTNVVQSLPDGVETIVGERGIRFSGGQCQRIALARAFYHDRSVLIMDEATSALDNETEQEIINEMELLKGEITIIVIAHNLKTLKHCHRIYELQNGRIIGMGSYNEIIDLKASQM